MKAGTVVVPVVVLAIFGARLPFTRVYLGVLIHCPELEMVGSCCTRYESASQERTCEWEVSVYFGMRAVRSYALKIALRGARSAKKEVEGRKEGSASRKVKSVLG